MIVNAGFQKTGVTTCGAALESLGFRYRKAPAIDRNDHIEGRSVIHRLDGYDACGDFPYPFLLYEIRPERVILTLRASSDEWLGSLNRHLNRRISKASKHYYFRDGKTPIPDDELIRMYEDHNEYVRRWSHLNRVPMLEVCWECGDGWKPLCEFLERPIPDKEFPWLNKS